MAHILDEVKNIIIINRCNMIKKFLIPSGYRKVTRASMKSKALLLVVTVMCAAYMIRKQEDMALFTKLWNEVKSIFDVEEFREAISYISNMLGI